MALYVIETQHPLDRICFPNQLLPVATYIAQPTDGGSRQRVTRSRQHWSGQSISAHGFPSPKN